MDGNDEYLRLPHGMYDRDEHWIKRARVILDTHDKCGEKIGCKVKKYSPLGFSSTFIKGANTATDKVYKFNSKTGKSLMLSCDSTPSIFREYVNSTQGEPKRISFVAPLFRYRKSHTRNFTQIGYSIINEKKAETDNVDIRLIEISKAMVNLCQSIGLKPQIHLNDYGALRNILSQYISEEELPGALHKLQFATQKDRIEFFKTHIKDEEVCNQMIDLFSRETVKVEEGDVKENKLNLPKEYKNIYKMAVGLNYITGADIYFNPTDLHSIETIDNYALRFKTENGTNLGDGGEYTNYAKRFNDKITSFWSVASGVEALERNSPEFEINTIKNKIAVCNIDASSEFVLEAIKALEELGDTVSYTGQVKNIGKTIKRLKDKYTHIVVLGKAEEVGENIKVKCLETGEIMELKSPVNKINIDFEEER